jgi:hypothetical protein
MKSEGPPKPREEMKGEQPKAESEKWSKLYDVIETDDGDFEVVLPGLFDKERGLIVGTSRERFESKEKAEAAIESSKENIRIMLERSSLEKSFTEHFYRIDKTEDRKFKVTLPGLYDSKTGYYVGTTSEEFSSWDEAKNYYLQELESRSKLVEHPILEVKTGEAEQIAFSDFDSFNPSIAPSEKQRDIPQSVEKYLLQRERMAREGQSASTYQETIKEEGWERKIYAFVSSYLEKDGKKIAKELGIKHLDSLTPRQAVELTTRLVVELTKYDYTEEEQSEPFKPPKKSKADQSTVLDLLNEGLANKGNDNWKGNGVCRNFACMTKAIFEALKANQTKFNRLRDTYCLYDKGMEEFAPERGKKNQLRLRRSGHAWNTFVTISKSGANATIVDTTWAKINLDTGKVEGLDYTLTRMEPVIHQIATELPEDAPDRKTQLSHIFSYYQLKVESGRMKSDTLPHLDERQKEENRFFISRVVDILKKQNELPEIPPGLLKIIGEEYKAFAEDADPSEIETLWRISRQNPEFPFRDILKKYLRAKSLTEYDVMKFIFRDDELQRTVFEQIKTHPGFEKFMKESPSFRIRMRKALPELFLGFSPGTNEADARELKHFIVNSRFIRFGYLFDAHQPSEESASRFFAEARKTLQSMNPEKYKQVADNLDDYELVKRYDSLYLQLSRK